MMLQLWHSSDRIGVLLLLLSSLLIFANRASAAFAPVARSNSVASRSLSSSSNGQLFGSLARLNDCSVRIFARQQLASTTRRQYANSENDDETDTEDDADNNNSDRSVKNKRPSRWETLDPRTKERIRRTGEERAILNKKKREPLQTKKRSE